MKKFTYALSLSFALTLLASPSWAYQVELGARFRAEYYWAYRPGTTYGNRDVRQPDLSTFIAAMPSTSYLRLDFTSLDRTTGGRVEIGFGVGPDHGGNRLDLRHIYGWYRFGRCKLIIGHTDNMLAIEKDYAPWQYLGLSGRQATFPLGPSDMMEGFGKLYSGRFTQAILYYYQGPWTFMVSVGQPGLNTSTGWAFSNNAGTVAVTNVWPRLDLAVEYRGKWFALVPGFSISEVRFEPMEGLHMTDDRVLSWLAVLPFRLQFGRFGIRGEAGMGQNWVTANMYNAWQAGVWWAGNNDAGNRIKLADTRLYSAGLSFSYEIGRATLWFSMGWQMTQNESNDQNGTWRHGQNVHYAFVFAVPYRVNKHLTIAPEAGYYYMGWDPTQDVGGSTNPARPTSTIADSGAVWIVGVQFQIRF
jgi:hypothetical protein